MAYYIEDKRYPQGPYTWDVDRALHTLVLMQTKQPAHNWKLGKIGASAYYVYYINPDTDEEVITYLVD